MDDDIVKALSDVDRVVADPMRFKARLEIGEKAYTSLTLADRISEGWNVVGSAMMGAAVMRSSVVVATFFGHTGWLGTSLFAATPIGWVVAGAVAFGGVCYKAMQFHRKLESNRMDKVPKFINTPLNFLAMGLCDRMMPLALKVAVADGGITDDEREVLKEHFVDEWGYDRHYIDAAMQLIEGHFDECTIQQLTEGLRYLTKENKDCNHDKVWEGFIKLLCEVADANGETHEKAKERIQEISDGMSKDLWLRKFKYLPVKLLSSLVRAVAVFPNFLVFAVAVLLSFLVYAVIVLATLFRWMVSCLLKRKAKSTSFRRKDHSE